MIFKEGKAVETIKGAGNPKALGDAIRKLASEADGGSSSSAGGFGGASSSGNSDWRSTPIPKGYSDVTEQVDVKGLELLNADTDFGTVRTLFETTRPSTLDNKGKSAAGAKKDWVESDTDEQLMLFIPFMATLKIHTIQVYSPIFLLLDSLLTLVATDHIITSCYFGWRRRDTTTPKNDQRLYKPPAYRWLRRGRRSPGNTNHYTFGIRLGRIWYSYYSTEVC